MTLLLPAAFGAAWLWLVPGGVIERAAADEQRRAEELLDVAATALSVGLRQEAAAVPVALQLDGERRVVAPFASSPAAASPPAVVSIAEQTANVRLDAGAVADALPFFVHAAADGSLTPEGWLRYVAARAAADVPAARSLLATAREQHRDARCGPLPFDVLALLCEVRLPGPTRTAWRDEFLAAVQDVPAAAVPIVLDELVATAPALADERLLALRAVAAAAAVYRATGVPLAPAPGPDGSVVIPIDDAHCAAVPAAAAARARDAAIAAAAAMKLGYRVERLAAGPDAPSRPIAALGETWSAVPTATPTSALLTLAARASLVLALVTLVLGNLLLWRLTRRESQLVRLRADFVDVVSHELRTPLTALSLKAEMLASGDVPAERRAHYVQALHQDVVRLTDQVERILDFGRLQKGAPLRRDVVPARTLLAKGLRQGRPALRLVDQKLEVHAARALPSIVGDVDVLSRALRNLIENAAKYAPPGSTVAVRAFAQGDELVVEVADRGPGVPAAERSSIFQPFVRGSDAPSGVPGSGLGLALVAAAAASHRGRVGVHERPGGGAVFTLQLPAQAPRGEAAG